MRKIVVLLTALALGCALSAACARGSGGAASAAATIAAAKATEAAAEATKAAAVQAIARATQLAQGGPTEAPVAEAEEPTKPAPTPVAATATREPAPVASPPPMPTPKACPQESEPFWHWQVGRLAVRAFFFPTSRVGFAVGERYSLLRTDDGGSNWRVWPIGAAKPLNAIYFTSPEIGWVAGEEGIILQTTDGGMTWKPQASGTKENLYVIEFLDDKTGWAAGSGGTLLRTVDGGTRWLPGATGQQIDIVDLAFIDAREGYLVGHSGPTGYVLRTSDGGATWQNTEYWGSVPEAAYAARDRQTWLVGGWVAGSIWKGIGHDSRTTVMNDVFPGKEECGGTGYHFRQVLFSDAQHGWAIGDCGLALSTQDGGASWLPMSIQSSAYWKMLRFTSEREAVLAGYNEFHGGLQVLHSSDGGSTWSPAPPGGSFTEWLEVVSSVDFVDPWFGWAVIAPYEMGPTSLFITSDGGQSWESHELLGGGAGKVAFVDRLRGWAVGKGGLVARTDDGGRNWQIQSIPFTEDLQTVFFVDREHGWVASAMSGPGTCQERLGEKPGHLTLFRTSSGGDEWEGPICIEVPVSMADHPRAGLDLHFVDQETGGLVGPGGVIARTTDGGLTWQLQASGVGMDLTDVYFLDGQTGWVTGDKGVLLETADGGLHWAQQRLGKERLTGVRFAGRNMGWVTSDAYPAPVFQTSDGGRTWNTITTGYNGLWTLDAMDERHVWIGAKGGIWAYAPVCLSPAKP